MKFKLHDLKESKVWKQANDEGKEEGKEEGKKEGKEEGKIVERENTVRKCLAKGMTEKQIAELLEIAIDEVGRLANGHAR